MSASDRHLIEAFKRGSAEALAAIYDKYVGLLVKVAGGMLDERSAAEDIVHDMFVKFAQSAGSLTINGSLKAYLITCVTNRVRDRFRKKVLPIAKPSEEAVTHSGPQQAVMQHETGQLVRRALAALPNEQRDVIVLRMQAELTFREIAAMLDIPENTAQSRFRYGMEKLKSLLDRELKP